MRWFESSYPSLTLPAWRNWQTRWTQNPVSARTCRFDPGRRYSIKDKVFGPCLFTFIRLISNAELLKITNFITNHLIYPLIFVACLDTNESMYRLW